jgi:nucleotidyltransferase substrate binding protein (TIGR01987 family)
MIDLSSLRNALQNLGAGLAALAAAPDDKFIRDACIKRFEYSYELSHKMLRRYLEATEPATTERLSFPSMIRLGFERGLLAHSWDIWTGFRDARNNTSHTYDEAKASAVLHILPAFAAEAEFLCAEIARRQLP